MSFSGRRTTADGRPARIRGIGLGLLLTAGLIIGVWISVAAQPRIPLDDTTVVFINVAPNLVHTTNGCAQFSVSVHATLTNARVFHLAFCFDQTKLALLNVMPAADPGLNLLPHNLAANVLTVDGFFHPNRTGVNILLFTITGKAIAAADAMTDIGFISGVGFGGGYEQPDTLLFSGDTTTVLIEGTPPRPPAEVVIHPFISLPGSVADSVGVYWRPVVLDMDGGPVINPLYRVLLNDVLNGTMYDLGMTPDTFFYNDFIVNTFALQDSIAPIDTSIVVNVGVYEIRACKTQP